MACLRWTGPTHWSGRGSWSPAHVRGSDPRSGGSYCHRTGASVNHTWGYVTHTWGSCRRSVCVRPSMTLLPPCCPCHTNKQRYLQLIYQNSVCVCARVHAGMRACVYGMVCVRACMCVRTHACMRVCVRQTLAGYLQLLLFSYDSLLAMKNYLIVQRQRNLHMYLVQTLNIINYMFFRFFSHQMGVFWCWYWSSRPIKRPYESDQVLTRLC